MKILKKLKQLKKLLTELEIIEQSEHIKQKLKNFNFFKK